MSLINDALKRAKQSQKKNQSVGGPALMPVEQESPSALAWILPVAIIILIVAACFVLGLAMAKHTVTTVVNAPDLAATQEVAAPTPVVPPRVQSASTNTEMATAPEPPQLQGIFYDPNRPWAILDGLSLIHI